MVIRYYLLLLFPSQVLLKYKLIALSFDTEIEIAQMQQTSNFIKMVTRGVEEKPP